MLKVNWNNIFNDVYRIATMQKVNQSYILNDFYRLVAES